jgi:hypothetical protein
LIGVVKYLRSCYLSKPVERADDALVELAGLVPDLVVSLGKAVLHDDLSAAKKVYDGAYVVTKIFY